MAVLLAALVPGGLVWLISHNRGATPPARTDSVPESFDQAVPAPQSSAFSGLSDRRA